MKNALNFIFLFLAVFPLTMYAQQEEFLRVQYLMNIISMAWNTPG